jgi:hypothetical protein
MPPDGRQGQRQKPGFGDIPIAATAAVRGFAANERPFRPLGVAFVNPLSNCLSDRTAPRQAFMHRARFFPEKEKTDAVARTFAKLTSCYATQRRMIRRLGSATRSARAGVVPLSTLSGDTNSGAILRGPYEFDPCLF